MTTKAAARPTAAYQARRDSPRNWGLMARQRISPRDRQSDEHRADRAQCREELDRECRTEFLADRRDDNQDDGTTASSVEAAGRVAEMRTDTHRHLIPPDYRKRLLATDAIDGAGLAFPE